MRSDTMRNAGLLVPVLLFAAGYAQSQTTYLEEGFTLETVTDDVPFARQIAEAPDGTLFVGSSSDCSRRFTNVYAVVPSDDGSVEVVTVDRSLPLPEWRRAAR